MTICTSTMDLKEKILTVLYTYTVDNILLFYNTKLTSGSV